MAKLRVGIVGCGTIGSYLADVLRKTFKKEATLVSICDDNEEKAIALQERLGPGISIVSLNALIHKSDLILETASASVSGTIARRVLKLNKIALIMSVGGLLSEKGLGKLAAKSKGKIWIPSGALAGVDALLAAAEARVTKIKLITRKPLKGLRGATYFEKNKLPVLRGKKEVCVFRGTALQAVKNFPQNINVAAILSLAGIGPTKTQVEIWTSLTYHCNQHEVIIEGSCGKIHAITQNVPSEENPKTSALAILSAVAQLRKIFSRIQIGT